MRKFVYEGERKFLILYPVDQLVEKGTEIETADKVLIKELLELGFKEIKKEGVK